MTDDEAPEISKVTPDMLEAEAADLDDLSASLDDDDDELDANELKTDDMEWTQIAKHLCCHCINGTVNTNIHATVNFSTFNCTSNYIVDQLVYSC